MQYSSRGEENTCSVEGIFVMGGLALRKTYPRDPNCMSFYSAVHVVKSHREVLLT